MMGQTGGEGGTWGEGWRGTRTRLELRELHRTAPPHPRAQHRTRFPLRGWGSDLAVSIAALGVTWNPGLPPPNQPPAQGDQRAHPGTLGTLAAPARVGEDS